VISAQRARFEPQVVVDYLSPHGSSATDVRAIVLQGALAQLKEAGHYDDYMARYPAEHGERVKHALASTWLPIDAIVAHFETLDRIGLSDAQIASLAERLGANIFDQLFATIVRTIRAAGGGDGIWLGFKQADRVMSRMYNGGSCRVTQTGPKDALYELRGLPGVNSRASRLSQCGFFRGVMSITAKACVVKVVPSPEPRSDRLALMISWV
jgi:hypothetical protein